LSAKRLEIWLDALILVEWYLLGVGRLLTNIHGGTAMYYFDFITAINPLVLAILAVVLVCGAYDMWAQSK